MSIVAGGCFALGESSGVLGRHLSDGNAWLMTLSGVWRLPAADGGGWGEG